MQGLKEVVKPPVEDDEDYEEWLNDEDSLYFVGVRYRFIGEDKTLEASQEEWYPRDVIIWGWKPNGSDQLNPYRYPDIPYGDPLFESAISYLVNNENALRISVLTETIWCYKRVNLTSRLTRRSSRRLQATLRSTFRRG
jgi:hypothetical protein